VGANIVINQINDVFLHETLYDMTHKAIKWIENQMKKLETPDFDFEVWETSTCLMLDTLFGKDNPLTQRLLNLDNTFNSWSLRDATGNESYEERSKKLATELLQSAIDEIQMLGLEDSLLGKETALNDILAIILDEMKGSQIKKLKQVFTSDTQEDEKRRQVGDIVRESGGSNTMLVNILMHPALISMLKSE